MADDQPRRKPGRPKKDLESVRRYCKEFSNKATKNNWEDIDIVDWEDFQNERKITIQTVASDETIKTIPQNKKIVYKKRTSSDRASKVRDGFTITALAISNRVLRSECVVGRCSIKKCSMPAIARKSSAVTSLRFCSDHAILNKKGHVDLIDSIGFPFEIKPEERPDILILHRDSWSFVARQAFKSLKKDYYPGSPKKPTVAFHRLLMEDSYGLARSGMAANKISKT
jgi:hypothetical protein